LALPLPPQPAKMNATPVGTAVVSNTPSAIFFRRASVRRESTALRSEWASAME
jgi:hypothetical protein